MQAEGEFHAPEGANVEALEAEIVALSSHMDAAMFRLLKSLRQFDDSGAWAQQGAKSCAHWLMWRTGCAAGVAREKVRVARALVELPRIGAALEKGQLSYSKVRALTRVARPDNEETLLDYALQTTAAQLERICRSYRSVQGDPRPGAAQRDVSFRHTPDGMVRVTATLHPDEAEVVWESLNQAAREGARQTQAEDVPAEATHSAQTRAAEADGVTKGTERSEGASAVPETVPAETREPAAQPEPVPGETREPAARPQAEPVPAETQVAAANPDQAPATAGDSLPTLDEVWQQGLQADASARFGDYQPVDGSGRLKMVDALVWLAERSLEGRLSTQTGGEMYQIMLHLAPDVLEPSGLSAELQDGRRICPETFRRIACDASLIPAATDGKGNVLDVGRKTRTIPPAIRRALQARDRKCVFPGCQNTRWLHGHHLEPWCEGGETCLDNLCLLCAFHHQRVHEGGFRVERLPGGRFAFYEPSGRRIEPVPQRPKPPPDPLRAFRNLGPDVDEAMEPGWDGRPVNYDACVAALMD